MRAFVTDDEYDYDCDVSQVADRLADLAATDTPVVRTYATRTLAGIAIQSSVVERTVVSDLIDLLTCDDAPLLALMDAVAFIAENEPAAITDVEPIVEQLSASDSDVRIIAMSTLTTLAATRPGAVPDAITAAVERGDDPSTAPESLTDLAEDHPTFVARRLEVVFENVATDGDDAEEFGLLLGRLTETNPAAVRPALSSACTYLDHENPVAREAIAETLARALENHPAVLAPVAEPLVGAYPTLADERLQARVLRSVTEAGPEPLEARVVADPDAFQPVVSDLVADTFSRSTLLRSKAAGALALVAAEWPEEVPAWAQTLATTYENGEIRQGKDWPLGVVATVEPARIESWLMELVRELPNDADPKRVERALTEIAAGEPSVVEEPVEILGSYLHTGSAKRGGYHDEAVDILSAIAETDPEPLVGLVDEIVTACQQSTGREQFEQLSYCVAAIATVEPQVCLEHVSWLVNLRSNKSKSIRRHAIVALAAIGTAYPDAVPDHVKALGQEISSPARFLEESDDYQI